MSCFQFLAITNNAALKCFVHDFNIHKYTFLLGIYLGVQLLSVQVLSFIRYDQFFKEVLPVHTPLELCESFSLWQWHPIPVLLLGKYRGQRSLLGCNPWGR